jgi:hypothetical protein
MIYGDIAKVLGLLGGVGVLWLAYRVTIDNAYNNGYQQAINETEQGYNAVIAGQVQDYNIKIQKMSDDYKNRTERLVKNNNEEWQRRYNDISIDLIRARDAAKKIGAIKNDATNLDRSVSADAARLLDQAASIVSPPTRATRTTESID